MYTSTFSDWFCQAVIDYMLGYRTLTVFSEFLLKLQSTDPRELIRLSKIRAEAVSTSVARVLSEGERFLAGWTLFSPEELDTKMGAPFEEKVLILVRGRQIYTVWFADWGIIYFPADRYCIVCCGMSHAARLLRISLMRTQQSYDYSLEKVKMYTRVPLGDIVGISKGLWILYLSTVINNLLSIQAPI